MEGFVSMPKILHYSLLPDLNTPIGHLPILCTFLSQCCDNYCLVRYAYNCNANTVLHCSLNSFLIFKKYTCMLRVYSLYAHTLSSCRPKQAHTDKQSSRSVSALSIASTVSAAFAWGHRPRLGGSAVYRCRTVLRRVRCRETQIRATDQSDNPKEPFTLCPDTRAYTCAYERVHCNQNHCKQWRRSHCARTQVRTYT